MEEKIILEGLCNRIEGAFVENGHAMITNQRFIYSKHSLAKIAVMGVLVNLTKGDYEFEIPLSDIVSVEETRRLFDKILIIKTNTEDYRFFFTKREEWKIAFNNALHNEPIHSHSNVPESVADELLKFKSLLDAGAITKEEYEEQKSKLLNK